MATVDPLDPAATPDLHRLGRGVRRLNQIPLVIGLVLVTGFVSVVALVAWDRAQRQEQRHAQAETRAATGGTPYAESLTAAYGDGYLVPEKPTIPPLPEPEEPGQLAATVAPPPEPPRTAPEPEPEPEPDPELAQFRQMRFEQFREAVEAGTKTQEAVPKNGGRAAGAQEPTDLGGVAERLESLKAQLQAAKSTAGGLSGLRAEGGGFEQQLAALQGGGTKTDPYKVFDKQGSGDRWRPESRVEAPGTPFLIRAGGVIPAVLVTGINSDLPGQVLAQVSQDVYDTATGQLLLIPYGTKIVGRYSSDIIFGQRAVLTAWQRLTFPDGKVLDIGAMQGSDQAGYAGFRDRVNTHFWRTMGSALMLSLVTAGVEYSQDNYDSGDNTTRAGDVISASVGQELGDAAAELIRKNMNTSPTLEIRQGYRINVTLTKDLILPGSYQAFDYQQG